MQEGEKIHSLCMRGNETTGTIARMTLERRMDRSTIQIGGKQN